jgi:hypothetical protein
MSFKKGQLVRIARLLNGYVDGVGTIMDEVPNKEDKYKVQSGQLVLWIEASRLRDEQEAIAEGRHQFQVSADSLSSKAFNLAKWRERWGSE